MSKVELLAKALHGTVVEDFGYRGIIYVEAKKEFVRFHSAHGVHVVARNPKTWRVVRPMFSPDEVRPFLEEAGVLPKVGTIETKPLDRLAKATQGEVVQVFHTGGGVVKLPSGTCLRYSNISGLDIVDYIVSKWRVIIHVMSRNDALKLLLEDPSKLVDRLAEFGTLREPIVQTRSAGG